MGRTLSGGEQQMLAIGRALDDQSAAPDPRRSDRRSRAGDSRRNLDLHFALEVARPVDPDDRQESARAQAARRPALCDRKGPHDVVRRRRPTWSATPAGCRDMSDSEFTEIEVSGRSTAARAERPCVRRYRRSGRRSRRAAARPFTDVDGVAGARSVPLSIRSSTCSILPTGRSLAAFRPPITVSESTDGEFVVLARARIPARGATEPVWHGYALAGPRA